MVSSGGEAAKKKSTTMGRYPLCWNIVMYDSLPVYKQDDGDNYLYINKSGNWCVGSVAGHTTCKIFQFSKNSPSPDKTVLWQYADNGNDWNVDDTLKVFPCY